MEEMFSLRFQLPLQLHFIHFVVLPNGGGGLFLSPRCFLSFVGCGRIP